MRRKGVVGRIKDYPNPFVPMTPDLAWVLGLWFADGCVVHFDGSGDRAILSQNDRELLEHVKALIAPSRFPERVRITQPSKSKHPRYWTLDISSNQFVKHLEALGVRPRKSLTMAWPSWPKGVLLSHFVRGLWDGDGYIGVPVYKASRVGSYLQVTYICGSWPFIGALRDVVASVVGKQIKIRRLRTCYRLTATAGTARKLCAWLYARSTEKTRLRRKYEVYAQQLARWAALERGSKHDDIQGT